jgi:hypothetical protein
MWLHFSPGRHLRDLPDGADEARDDQKGHHDLETILCQSGVDIISKFSAILVNFRRNNWRFSQIS